MPAELAPVVEFTPERVALVKRTICVGASNDELEMFIGVCRRTGLDPFARQIYAVKRFDKRSRSEKMTIQVGIDGFRLIAFRTGELDGQDGPYWCGPDGEWRDVWLAEEPPSAAKVTVYRKGCSRGYVGVATWEEFAQRFDDGNPMGLWGRLGPTMLAKCAESQALRKGFPQELSGVYSPEEMAQADEPEVRDVPVSRPSPRKAAEPDPAAVALFTAKSLDELAAAWKSLHPSDQYRVRAIKDRIKEYLSSNPADAPPEQQPDPPAPQPEPHSEDDGVGEPPVAAPEPKAGMAIQNKILTLLAEAGLDWPQVRDDAGAAKGAAAACGFTPGNVLKVGDLTASQALKLQDWARARAAEKAARKRKAAKELEGDPEPEPAGAA